VGEMHNCVVCHWLEGRILRSLHQVHGRQLAMGMEMMEADDQLVIDEYQKGLITADRFRHEARFWPNYETDYEPLVDFACEQSLPVVATNVPRRYANAVKNHGLSFLDSISEEAKRYLPPLPIACQSSEQAQAALGMMAMIGTGRASNAEWLAQSQALKDATMAWNIAKWVKKDKGGGDGWKMVHFNGNYHTAGGEGILVYLKQYAPQTSCKTIYSVRQEDITRLDETYWGQGDYIICVTEDMVTSY